MNVKTRVALGLVGIIASTIMLGSYFGLVPDKASVSRQARATISETIAIHSTSLVLQDNAKQLSKDFDFLLSRNPELISVGIKRLNGEYMTSTEQHTKQWKHVDSDSSFAAQIQVPIYKGEARWGELELAFEPLARDGLLGLLDNPLNRLLAFLGLICFPMFYFYLGKVLKVLDPSSAVPDRVRSALDTMAEGLLILDNKETIVLANQAFSEMLDLDSEQLVGQKVTELPWKNQSGNTLKEDDRPWLKALATGDISRNGFLKLQDSTGLNFSFKVNCSPIQASANRYSGVLVSLNDITELEEKEVQLRNSMEEAEAANQAKSSFLANMSHEIRTPMNAILGFTEILKRGYTTDPKESQRYLNIINSSGKSLLALINDILDLSKVESGNIEMEIIPTALHELIYDVVHVLGLRATEKGIDFRFEALTPLPKSIQTDPTRIRQVLLNLAGNAIKFTDEGEVVLRTRIEQHKGETWLQLDISDTGIGMAKDKLPTIFDPFTQADTSVTRRFGGTGLGLSISKKFVEALDGEISVDSDLGKGSTFSIRIRTGDIEGIELLQPEELTIENMAGLEEEAVAWSFPEAHVLVIDDGPENRELVRFLLEDAGVTVEEAENGKIGLEKAIATDFDVILMDVQMPVMDGFEAATKMREHGLTTPVVALTANAMNGFADECYAVGYSDFFAKPIDVDKFMAKMVELLGGQQTTVKEKQAQRPAPSEPEVETVNNVISQLESDIAEEASGEPIVSSLSASNPRFAHLIERFVVTLKDKHSQMETAVKAEDYKELADLAHWLKGAGGTIGFDHFTQPAAKMEQAAKGAQKDLASEHFFEITQLAKRVEAGVSPSASTASPTTAPTAHHEQPKPSLDLSDPIATEPEAPTRSSTWDTPIESRLSSNPRFHGPVSAFVGRLKDKIAELEPTIQPEQLAEMKNFSHWLKGSAGTVGYDAFTEPATALDNYLLDGDISNAEPLLAQIIVMTDYLVSPQKKPELEKID